MLCFFVQATADAGVKQFVFVSVHDYKAPSAIKKIGYFDGKRRTEKVIGELFGEKVKSRTTLQHSFAAQGIGTEILAFVLGHTLPFPSSQFFG